MKILIVQIEVNSGCGFTFSENQETWLVPDEIATENIVKDWKKRKEEFPQFYKYVEFLGGQLLDFDEVVK